MNRLPFALRLPLQCGGWTSLLLLVGTFGGLPFLLAGFDPGPDPAPVELGLVVAGLCTLFWSLLGVGRLAAIGWQAHLLRLPGLRAQLFRLALGTLLLTVLLPALVHAALGSPLPQALAVLWLATMLGLFWVSMPPWLVWPMILLGAAQRWLPSGFTRLLADALVTPAGMGVAGLVAALLAAVCWRLAVRRGALAGPWSTPLALTVAQTLGSLQAGSGAATGTSLLAGGGTASGLRAAPLRALAVGLGPGFGVASPRSLLGTHGPTLAVAVFWLLIGAGAEDSATPGRHVGLVFAPIMVLATALAPLLRLETLFRRPAMGLYELALSPGLPTPAAPALLRVLLRQLVARAGGGLLIMAGFAAVVGVEPGYYPLLLVTSLSSLLLLGGTALLTLTLPWLRPLLVAVMIVVTLALFGSMLLGIRATDAGWLLSVWLAVAAVAALPWSLSLARLRARPHPWLPL